MPGIIFYTGMRLLSFLLRCITAIISGEISVFGVPQVNCCFASGELFCANDGLIPTTGD
jgi:hypothetical protein